MRVGGFRRRDQTCLIDLVIRQLSVTSFMIFLAMIPGAIGEDN